MNRPKILHRAVAGTTRVHPMAECYNDLVERSENIYGFARRDTFRRFSDRLEGNASGLLLVTCTEPLSGQARDALLKSFAALGYGADACTFAHVDGLDARELFSLVEGVDPLILIATDEKAATLCSQAARSPFPLMQRTWVFGREARAFPHLNEQLGDEESRQAVWRALKTLS